MIYAIVALWLVFSAFCALVVYSACAVGAAYEESIHIQLSEESEQQP